MKIIKQNQLKRKMFLSAGKLKLQIEINGDSKIDKEISVKGWQGESEIFRLFNS